MSHRWSVAMVVSGIALGCAAHAVAEPNVVLPRPGQVGIGIQGQYGQLARSGDLGDLFSNGPGIGVHVRYRMRLERAIGLSFESHRFEARETGAPGDTTAKRLNLILSGFDIYQMFGTRSRTTKMLSVGAGLMQASAKLNTDETVFPDDGLYVSAGAGIEHFFFRSWAYELNLKYFSVFQHQKTNHDFQASAGLIFYASY